MMMSKKIKAFVLESKAGFDCVKARSKHQRLMEDFEELQTEFNDTRSRLDAAKQKELILAAEVRFLRRRYRLLTMKHSTFSSQEQPLVPSSTFLKQTKSAKKHMVNREETNEHLLTSGLVPKPKKRRTVNQQPSLAIVHPQKKALKYQSPANGWALSYPPMPQLNQSGITIESAALDLNHRRRTHGANDNSNAGFYSNYDSTAHQVKEPSSKARIFDLNEVSMGDEDRYSNVEANKFEESMKSILKRSNNKPSNDLKFSSVCRNADESLAPTRKRKISWKDPVALVVTV